MRSVQTALIAIVVGVLVFGACGGGTPAAAPTSAPTSAATSAPTQAQDRVVKHAMGETKVPANPQRVVVLDTGLQDHVIRLGVRPVGAAEPVAGGGFIKYLEPQLAGAVNLGFVRTPNIERVAALKPDLILGSKSFQAAIYDQLTKIAPTVFVDNATVDWKGGMIIVASALGKTAEAERVASAYQARVAEFKTKMGTKLADLKIAYIRAALDKMYIYHNTSFAGSVLKELGVKRPTAQDKDAPPSFAEAVTKERLKDLDGDAVFYSVYGANGPDTMRSFTTDPLWSQLSAAQAKRVFEVSDEMWAVAIGYTAAETIMDNLLKHLLQ